MDATTISLLNMKGGVGKTTLAVNLAWHLCRRDHRRVLLIDLDPQFNASQYLMDYATYDEHAKLRGTVADLLLEPAKTRMTLRAKKPTKRKGPSTTPLMSALHCVEETSRGGRLDLLPSDLNLGNAIKNPQGIEYKLEKALGSVRSQYEYIFIDCAPTISVLTAVALMASDYVMTPVKPDRFSILGHEMMQGVLEDFRRVYPDPRSVADLGVVFTQVQGDEDIELGCMEAVAQSASYVFEAQIRQSTRSFLRAVHEQTPVFDTRYATKVTRASITSLVREMEARLTSLRGGDPENG